MYTDIYPYRKKTTLFQYIPRTFWPYILLARWDRPVGIFLLMLPGWWGLALGQGEGVSIAYYVYFFIGAICLRGAGCTLNDLIDAPLDAKVERTRQRPLACGAISRKKALIFLGLQMAVGGTLLLLFFNMLTIFLGLSALGMVALYPFMKRWTYWPQLFLGFTFNYGVLMGYAAIANSLNLSAFMLYVVGILWTLVYDTVYAYQDREDDILVGVKSLALKLGNRPKPFLLALIGVMGLCLTMLWESMEGPVLSLLLIWASIGMLAVRTLTLRIENREDCLRYFKQNMWFGGLIFVALIIK